MRCKSHMAMVVSGLSLSRDYTGRNERPYEF